jgi:NRPS condensation-like uncharacterized protein
MIIRDYFKKGKDSTRFVAEMWDQLQIFGRTLNDEHLRAELKFNGQLDYSLIKKAVKLSFIAEPILKCKYVEHFWRSEWIGIQEINWSEVVSFELIALDHKNVDDFLTSQINPFEGPQIRIKLFRSRNDTLCVLLNHTVGDGYALKYYLYLLAKIYRKIIYNPDYVPEPQWIRSRNITQVSNQLTLGVKLKIVLRSLRKQKKFKDWTFPWRKTESNGRKMIITRKLSPIIVASINKYCEKYHSWPNEVLLAAYFRTLWIIIQPSKDLSKRICVPMNLRKYLPVRKAGTICNLSATLHLNLGTNIGKTFSDTLDRVNKEMNVIKNNYPGLVGRGFFAILMNLLPYTMLKKKLIEISNKPNYFILPPWMINFGIINETMINFDHAIVNELYIAQFLSCSDKVSFQLGITGFKDCITLSVCYQGNEDTDQLVQQFFTVFDNELQSIC